MAMAGNLSFLNLFEQLKKFLTIILILLLSSSPVKQEGVEMFYCYRLDDYGGDSSQLASIHDAVIESGYKNIALGAYQSTLRDNIQKVLDEIDWFRTWNEEGKIWLIQYDTTTQLQQPEGYSLSEWENNFKTMSEHGVELFLIDVGEYTLDDPNSFLTTINNLAKKYGVKFGFFDGDGLCNKANFSTMKAEGIYVWSTVGVDGEKTWLASGCGKDYPYLITLFWLGSSIMQFDSRAEFEKGLDFIKRTGTYGNVVEVYDYEGIMPAWGYIA